MSLLQVKNLNKYYGAVPIIREAELIIHPDEKWGLIGLNGSGKTTLLKILTGEEDYDNGQIQWSQNCRIGYLEQTPDFNGNCSVYQELRNIFHKLDEMQNNLNGLQERMADSSVDKNQLNLLIEEFHRLTEEFELAGGYQIQSRIQGVLNGLGLPKARWEDPISYLSGGERTRLALAKILLTENDILLLDEPTNYLDLAAIEWLEGFLKDFKGAVLIISHDRYFLDQVVQGIYEIEFCKIKRYKGNYTAYRLQKMETYETLLKAYQEQEKYLAKQEKFIRESRATEKSKRKAHSLEKRLQGLELIEKPQINNSKIKFSFNKQRPSSRQVVELDGIKKGFGSKILFNNVATKIEYGEKIGLIGPNGAGKTTLLKMILGLEKPDHGSIRLGYEVYPGFFSQLDEDLDMCASSTPFEQIMQTADLDNTEARTILGRFLFSGDAVFKEISSLSGGERRRLGLIKLMFSNANFLILDEPTNHLDLSSIEAIENVLQDFDGTILVVSHDRYFLNKIVDRYLAITDGGLYSFASYQEYLDWRSEKLEVKADIPKIKNESQLRRENNKALQRELKKKQRNLNEIEADIYKVEERKSELVNILNDPAVHTDYKKSLELSQELSEIEETLTILYARWEEAQHELSLSEQQ